MFHFKPTAMLLLLVTLASGLGPGQFAEAQTRLPQVGTAMGPEDSRVERKERDDAEHPERHARLTVEVAEAGVEILHFDRVAGPIAPHPLVRGDFIVLAYLEGELAWIDSMPDPFNEKGHHEDLSQPRHHGQTEAVHLNLPLPERFLEPESAAQASVLFYLTPMEIDLPEEADSAALLQLLADLEPIAALNPDELLAALERERQ